MKIKRSVTRMLVLLGTVLAPFTAQAQLISLKTVPVAAGDQFLLFPSRNLGMGGVSIAVDDPLMDPFVNPALGSLTSGSLVFGAGTYYTVTSNAGSAGSLPLGVLFRSREWFGGGMAAIQQLSRGDQFFGPVPFFEVQDVLPPDALSEQSATNKYGFFTLGRTLPGGFSLGGSVFLADLSGVDGVEHLYAMAQSIQQSGDMADLRLGLTKSFSDGQRLEAVVLHNRWDVRHDVGYVDWVVVDSTNWIWEPQSRFERNRDRTNTWGAHLGYVRPVGQEGWRVGGILTFNRKSHPKIPNYELANIPRDPGNSSAWNLGLGLAKVSGPLTFGFDLIYEPASSETWAEAAERTETASGEFIPKGGKTVENSFDFSDAFVRMGVKREVGPAAFGVGLQMRAYDFHLDQWDNVAETFRRQDEDWIEWTPSWSGSIDLGDVELLYLGRVTTGTGRPGVAWAGGVPERAADFAAAADVVLAPSGPLTLQDVSVITHQLSITLPIK